MNVLQNKKSSFQNERTNKGQISPVIHFEKAVYEEQA